MTNEVVQPCELNLLHTGVGYVVGTYKSTDGVVISSRALVGLFDGLNALLDYQSRYQTEAQRDKSSIDSGSFYHFPSYDEARNTYITNPKSVLSFSEKNTLIDGGESSGKGIVYDVTGDYVDVGRYLDGEPECFASLTDGNPRNRRVTILFDVSWVYSTSQETINSRAERIVRLVDWLESQNVRTQVIAVYGTECAYCQVLVKQFDEPLNLNDIAVTGHGDYLRRIMFRFVEYSQRFNHGYGSSHHFTYTYSPSEPELQSEFLVSIANHSGDIPGQFDKLESDLQIALADDYDGTRVFKVLA